MKFRDEINSFIAAFALPEDFAKQSDLVDSSIIEKDAEYSTSASR